MEIEGKFKTLEPLSRRRRRSLRARSLVLRYYAAPFGCEGAKLSKEVQWMRLVACLGGTARVRYGKKAPNERGEVKGS